MPPLRIEYQTEKERIVEELAVARKRVVDDIAKSIKDPSSEAEKSGNHVVVHLPRLRFFKYTGASMNFLLDLENTIGAPREAYSESHVWLKVKCYPADARLPPSLESFNKAFGMTLRKEIVAAHIVGGGEDYNPLNLSL